MRKASKRGRGWKKSLREMNTRVSQLERREREREREREMTKQCKVALGRRALSIRTTLDLLDAFAKKKKKKKKKKKTGV